MNSFFEKAVVGILVAMFFIMAIFLFVVTKPIFIDSKNLSQMAQVINNQAQAVRTVQIDMDRVKSRIGELEKKETKV